MEIVERNGSVIFTVRVVPRSSKSRIVGEYGEALRVQLLSPPVDGAANAELIKLLAKEFGVSKINVEIISGHTSRSKQVCVTGFTPTALNGVLKAKT